MTCHTNRSGGIWASSPMAISGNDLACCKKMIPMTEDRMLSCVSRIQSRISYHRRPMFNLGKSLRNSYAHHPIPVTAATPMAHPQARTYSGCSETTTTMPVAANKHSESSSRDQLAKPMGPDGTYRTNPSLPPAQCDVTALPKSTPELPEPDELLALRRGCCRSRCLRYLECIRYRGCVLTSSSGRVDCQWA